MTDDVYKLNYATLARAIEDGNSCVVECTDKTTGNPVVVICALSWEEDGTCVLIPFAKLFDGDPYEELILSEQEREVQ